MHDIHGWDESGWKPCNDSWQEMYRGEELEIDTHPLGSG